MQLQPEQHKCILCRAPVKQVLQLLAGYHNRQDDKCSFPGCPEPRNCISLPCHCFDMCMGHAEKFKACPCKTKTEGRQKVWLGGGM